MYNVQLLICTSNNTHASKQEDKDKSIEFQTIS